MHLLALLLRGLGASSSSSESNLKFWRMLWTSHNSSYQQHRVSKCTKGQSLKRLSFTSIQHPIQEHATLEQSRLLSVAPYLSQDQEQRT